MSLPTYQEYKNVGVQWLDQIPSGWDVKRFKQVFVERDERSIDGSQTLLSVSAYTGVSPRSEIRDQDEHISRSESLEGYKVCYPNDLVINIMLAWNRGLGVSSHYGIVSPAYCVFKIIDDSEPDFLDYLVRTDEYTGYFKAFSSGVIDSRLRIYPDTFRALYVGLPNKVEQQNIAKFLNYETSKIDSLIAEQEKLIKLLKTKLDTLVLGSFNSSGTTYTRLIHAVELVKRPVIQQDETLYEPLGLFNRGRGLFHKEHRAKAEMGDSDFHWIEEGDLILSGQFAWEGAVALAYSEEEGCVVSHRYHVLRGREGVVLTEYLFAMFTTSHGDFLLNESSVGAAGRNRPLNINLLLKEVIPIPDIKTQEKIAVLVLERRNLLREIHEQKKLINERRSALISAAVTGQIDVRNYQPKNLA
jgi:type I restriction enzyme S subunit